MNKLDRLDVDRAFDRVRMAVANDGSAADLGYFGHEARYKRNISRLLELAPPGSTLLDVGSHFLHQSAVLSELGYRVVGMDIAEFASAELIKNRASQFKIENHVVERFERGDFLPEFNGKIDVVLFSEIQEHITFNPIGFWRQIYRLLKIDGIVFLTTPNSLTMWKIAHVMKRLLLLQGYGICVDEILDRVTYGHHWKEYSAYELRLFFKALSPDFEVVVTPYELRPSEKWTDAKSALRDVVRRGTCLVPAFREELEAVITLKGRTGWRLNPPEYF